MKQLDLLVVLGCAIAVLFSFYSGTEFYLTPAWYHPIETSLYKNGEWPDPTSELLPKPVIADLDGDGFNEIILVTLDYKLKVLQAPLQQMDENTMRELPVKAHASLLTTFKVTTGRRPVALATGYLTPFYENHRREQVIVVVTSGWNVLCFSSSLKLIWESTMLRDVKTNVPLKEAAIIITSQPLRVSDANGAVIVGGKLDTSDGSDNIHHVHHSSILEMTEQLTTKLFGPSANEEDEEEESLHDAEKRDVDAKEQRASIHFSYYAYEGAKGSMRWKHEPSDFVDSEESEAEHHHGGEAHWEAFDASLQGHLPHVWRTSFDTFMELGHFEKQSEKGGRGRSGVSHFGPTKVESAWNLEAIGMGHDHLPGVAWGGHTPHDESEHIHSPNVIVVHLWKGIEVIHLYTGRTLCTLALSKGTYIDVNNDGVIDRLQSISGRHTGSKRGKAMSLGRKCYGVVTSGVPATQKLFNCTICHSPGPLSALEAITQRRSKRGDEVSFSIPPVAIPRSDGIGRDVVFLVSSGRMSSYRPDGESNWQIFIGATWAKARGSIRHYISSSLSRSGLGSKTEKSKYDSLETYPSLLNFKPEVFGKDAILAIGRTGLVVVSSGGHVIAEAELPDPLVVTAPPSIGDVNGDGTNDIIITTPEGYIGFVLHHRLGFSSLFQLMLLTVCGLTAAIMRLSLKKNTTIKSRADRKADILSSSSYEAYKKM